MSGLLAGLRRLRWFGIQAWIGGEAIHKILAIFIPAFAGESPSAAWGSPPSQLGCFLFFWGINMW